jgi:hypothetical protein
MSSPTLKKPVPGAARVLGSRKANEENDSDC